MNYRTYTRNNPAPQMIPCACGVCGMSYPRIITNRTRKWAPGCPNRAAMLKQAARDKQAVKQAQKAARRAERDKLLAQKRLEKELAKAKGRNAAKVNGYGKFCGICAGLTERRPLIGVCPGCKLPYVKDINEGTPDRFES